MEYKIVNARLLYKESFLEGEILIKDGKTHRVSKNIQENLPKIDAEGKLLLPGLIDPHAHLRDSLLSYKEDFDTGTSAALAGGYTLLLDMPNTKPQIDSPERIKKRIEEAKGKINCDVGFYSLAFPNSDFSSLFKAGAIAIKIYLHKRFRDEEWSYENLRKVMKELSKFKRVLAFHAEELDPPFELDKYDVFLHSSFHDERAEIRAVKKIIDLAKDYDLPIHFCHISTPQALEEIYYTKLKGLNLTLELTPHHLLLDDSYFKLGNIALVEPPLRALEDVMELRKALYEGKVDMIGSDHAPHTIDEKLEEKPLPGFPNLEISFSLLNTLTDKFDVINLIKLMSINVARRFGLKKVGAIEEGYKANLFLFDPKEEWRIDPLRFLSKAKYSPFQGFLVRGKVKKTLLRGNIVYEDGVILKRGLGEVII
ncbi:MAG: dihydroorotase family protein [Nitrososphaerales archaeon]